MIYQADNLQDGERFDDETSQKMKELHVRHLAVLVDTKIAGIVSWSELLNKEDIL